MSSDTPFAWSRVRGLFGLPYEDDQIQRLLKAANVDPEELWQEVRVGIYSMPPYDAQPCPVADIDLRATHHVDLTFKHARLVKHARTGSPSTFVLFALTYYMDKENPEERFQGELPWGLLPTDNAAQAEKRMGRPPTNGRWGDGDGYGFIEWEDTTPTIHLLFTDPGQQLLRVSVIMPFGESP